MSRQLTAYDAKRPALTKRGEATRRRILEAATDLIFDQGATSTTLDEVRAVTRTSKSQLYHYFADKSDLVRAVIEHQTQRMIDAQRPLIDEIESFEDLVAWRDHLVTLQRDRRCGGGCPLGSLAGELADVDETARLDLVRAFDHWQGHLLRGLTRMRDRRELRADADPDALATAIMAGLQGGFLLSQTMRSARPLAIALDAALTYVRSHLAPETRSSGLQTRDSERSR